MERKLAEAKKRREALKAKYAKPGEESAGATEVSGGATGSTAAAPEAPEAGAASAGALANAAPSPGSAGGRAPGGESGTAPKEGAASGEAKSRAPSPEASGGGDMFDASAEAAEQLKKGESFKSSAISFTGASNEDWDDEDGYYMPKIGEVMDDRWLVTDLPCGRGVFSNVVKAKDTKAEKGDEGVVAIKVMRRNDMMTKAAEKEVEILERLNNADRKNKRGIVRLFSTFAYRRHFCFVFECMADDLRGALKKHTKNKGMTLSAVRAYTSQLLVGLGHMRDNGVIHADIKPDNILLSKNMSTVKFCDLGTAVELKDVNPSPYLASRFYRPPEVILGCEFSFPVDMWALGCTLYEIFTGKTLLNSKTNNDHLKKIMDLRGKVPGKVIKKGFVWQTHFTPELDFKHEVEDPGSGQKVIKTITDFTNKVSLKDLILERVGKEKQQSQEKEDQLYVKRAIQFADLLEQMLALDPDKRIRPEDGLIHPFLLDGFGKAAQAQAAEAAKKR
eukprot:SRR837773.20025.p1 GENE.SRR837773.20025~~SRR837773.20025.p1  ORF type:complete len:558 (-),score=234.90 SRR837773.20025:84-1595(-)